MNVPSVNRALIETVDSETCVIYLEVPGTRVVLFQGFFELYEGVGTVRTLDIRNSLVCVITTPTMLDDCLLILEAMATTVPWRMVAKPEESKCAVVFDNFQR